jgi:general secretion pathway protein K
MRNRNYNNAGIEKRDSEKGIVLVIVIIVIAVLMILVTDLIYFTEIDTEISSNTRDELKAKYIAKSGVHVAAGTLKERPLEELAQVTSAMSGQTQNPDGFWEINVPFFPVGDGSVSVTVTDERAKVNLNSLVNSRTDIVDQQVLTELRELFRFLNVDNTKSDRFISSLINWLDAPIEGAQNDQDPAGANGDFYAHLKNPYKIKDGPLDTVEEIRMIDGMDDDFYNKIKDYVTVYPSDKKINFSTAPRVVLMAAIKAASVSAIARQGNSSANEIDDDTAGQIADQIIEARKDTPIIDQRKIREIVKEVAPDATISAGIIGVSLNGGESETFTVRSVGSLGEVTPTQRIIIAVIKKTRLNTRNNQSVVKIVTWKEL